MRDCYTVCTSNFPPTSCQYTIPSVHPPQSLGVAPLGPTTRRAQPSHPQHNVRIPKLVGTALLCGSEGKEDGIRGRGEGGDSERSRSRSRRKLVTRRRRGAVVRVRARGVRVILKMLESLLGMILRVGWGGL